MKTVAIVQARMGSSRLPGKVMADLDGHPVLWRVCSRLQRARTIDEVVVATTDQASDQVIQNFCADQGIGCFRGSENDVLDRFYQAGRFHGADTVVRVTADCPLIDPQVVDRVVGCHREGHYDFASNVNPPTFPDGLDTEVMTLAALGTAWREARLKSEREHVTPYLHNHHERFTVGHVAHSEDLSAMRWTVDEPGDLAFVRAVLRFLPVETFGMDDVVAAIRKHPELMGINAGIQRNEGYAKSLREDRVVNVVPHTEQQEM